MALVHVHVSVQTINEGSTVYENKMTTEVEIQNTGNHNLDQLYGLTASVQIHVKLCGFHQMNKHNVNVCTHQEC